MLPGPLCRAIVPGSHGGVALSAEHSRGGNALSSAALRDGEQRQRLKCREAGGVWRVDNKGRRTEAGEEQTQN